MRLFSTRNRPLHLGPYPVDRLKRGAMPDLSGVPHATPVGFERPDDPASIVNAMRDAQAMLDVLRTGAANPARSEIPADPVERANHLKAFAHFCDADMAGVARIPKLAWLDSAVENPAIAPLTDRLRTEQTNTLAAGIDQVMADLRSSVETPPAPISHHTHALVLLYAWPRDPREDEPGSDWIMNAQAQRACLRGAETATVLANYIRLLGWDARAHSGAAADVCMNRLAVAAGLVDSDLAAPWLGHRYGLSVITTDIALACDAPLAPMDRQPWYWMRGPGWQLGTGHTAKTGRTADPYANRDFADGPHPFETLKRVDDPTTYIDEPNVARVPKRTDLFARAQFGDMGRALQKGAAGGLYVRRQAPSLAQRRALGAFVLLQDGPAASPRITTDPARNAANLKAASYFLGMDAVGLSRCPEWAWYSHDALGDPIDPPHDQAISMIVDQGYETMEGASGDDWISVAQSMRAYLRFSILGSVIAQQIRNLGFSAKAHSVMDGEVLQPPLLLLSGLGEVSRIGEVILNPFLGPRLKSGAVTTDMPVAHDRPIDFGLQRFCEACNKCARECPSGAITAGPKRMFNGYEIWKSDSQRCAAYRITTQGGAMCGRCMKTCPWNLEGLFAEAPFRWAAMHIPAAAPVLAKLDDAVGNGGLNDSKKWWWDIELKEDGSYGMPAAPVNRRDLQKDLVLRHEDQTLAVYPAPLAPWPWPYPFPMDREAGIAAYKAMLPAEDYRARSARGETGHIHRYTVPGDPPVVKVTLADVSQMTPDITKYTFTAPDGAALPRWSAGAHLDVVVTPEFLRQYSMSGDPADRSRYEIGVLREDAGRGGSAMLHRIFTPGRRVFVSKPINHFGLVENAEKTFLMGGGIGITPMIAFAHSLHALGRDFALHYSCSSRTAAAYLDDLSAAPWADRVHLHFSDEGSRADLSAILTGYRPGWHVYTCGPNRYIDAVIQAAEQAGFPEEARHLEYFSAPEEPDYENYPFTLQLRDGRQVNVAADQSATDALAAAGVHVDVKCAEGLCGVCQCRVLSGDVEHRDFVLSASQRQSAMILCKSRAATADAVIELDL
ncbi:2Fe-2S iron-sulfur cluster-binding protein [Lutimaribacter sp. EGI FJ00015]|uniref:2Fe-2S iron-sulfur cluster-binding protein n=1 Tax=Lutimaribacter degradans TaxID=2945989 RepID=A0ACC5ZWR4_9RHOB|nr:2Fe-2S iron-sulfur cluster-binding protein [Lutimaribacter sp. EGI FJ00013]MCM2562630.1 2Fe-2S iron-sulfur cluster-binding protein [Lutimaribacter sp. EGI FJ00013]MCO0613787.1 2Fe-2S iron-sulfur cluster-binding protein [Lutimaribacter sp. EGI FJ00015]MCO0636730.1 2Fe-2S iron-sulfur cluster-binding protein [Lutimaribacter sp. EGI FJ00014]